MMDDKEKRRIIGVLVSTPEGRAKLAAAMTSPTRCPGWDYPSTGWFRLIWHSLVKGHHVKFNRVGAFCTDCGGGRWLGAR